MTMEFRRFKIKNEPTRERLESLIEEKDLSREDLILILSAIEINQEAFYDDVEEVAKHDTLCKSNAAAAGERIKELRKRAGLTQEELAALISVDRQTISHYETGVFETNVKAILRWNLEKLASALHTTTGYLMGYERREGDDDNVRPIISSNGHIQTGRTGVD